MTQEQSPRNLEKEQYMDQKRSQAMILQKGHFAMMAQMYLSEQPLVGAAAFRRRDGIEGIIINWDQYQVSWSTDYTYLIPYEVEHEAEELWLTRGKTDVDSFGPDHYSAIKAAIRMAHQHGHLSDYLELKREQMQMFQAMGDDHATEEYAFYLQVAEELRK